MTWIPNSSRTTLYRSPRRMFYPWPVNSTTPQDLQHHSCSLSEPSSAKSAETLNAPLILYCLKNTLIGSDVLLERSCSPKKYISPARSSSNIQLNSSFSSTEACKDTVHASTLTPMINSTFSTVQQRYWGKLRIPPLNPK